MPENKSQHYVPRAHLKPFTAGGEGIAINLFNLQRSRPIRNAPVKSQCAQDYFYGEDGVLEKLLQGPEGNYATALRNVMTDAAAASHQDFDRLLEFATLQMFRSHGYIEKLFEMGDNYHKGLLAALPERAKPPHPMFRGLIDATMMSLSHYARSRTFFHDLDRILLTNASHVDFITSDDPAIHTNRFHIQKRHSDAFGVSSSGIMLYLPLSPRLAFLAFDPHVYIAQGRVGNVVNVPKDSDVHILNSLQHLNARNNVYFSQWDDRVRIESVAASLTESRLDQWHKLRYFERVEVKDGVEKFVVVEEMKLRPGIHYLTQFQPRHIRPPEWPSLLSYRLRPEMVDTGSAAGAMRPNNPRTKDLFERLSLRRSVALEKHRAKRPFPTKPR